MKFRFFIFSLLVVLMIAGCTKDKTIIPPKGVKTAATGYSKTVTDGASIIGSWKNTSSLSYWYDVNGVLITQNSPGLINLQVIDTANLKETNADGIVTNDKIRLSNTGNIMYLNFMSDEGYNTYAIDTLQSNKLTISQILKSPTGIVAGVNGTTITAYQETTVLNYTRVN